MKRHLCESCFTILFILSISFRSAFAEEGKPYCEDEACFPEKVHVLDLELSKVSQARYRYYGFLVFDSALYAQSAEIFKRDFLGRDPIALKLCYHRELQVDDFRQSAIKTLALNPNVPSEQLQPRIELLHSKYREVREGDCYQLSFKPGKGTELAFNGTPLVLIPGDDFAQYYLGIWLSPYSFSESLTRNLTTPLQG